MTVKKRAILREVIPLCAPYSIYIDPSSACNFKCKFCPTSDDRLLKANNRKKGFMNYVLFCKIVDDIAEFDTKIKRLFFHKDGEPTLNKELPKMLKYAVEKNISEVYELTTNASLLTPQLSKEIIDSGIDVIKISIEGVSNEKYKENAGVNIQYEKIKENIEYLYKIRRKCHIYVKIIDVNLTLEEKDKFYSDFANISSSIAIENLHCWTASDLKEFTLGVTPERSANGYLLSKKEVCPYPFYALSINYDGSVGICCTDWTFSTIVGDVKVDSLRDIWNGKELYDFRIMHLKRERYKNKACASCQFLEGLLDNIDKDTAVILGKLTSSRCAD